MAALDLDQAAGGRRRMIELAVLVVLATAFLVVSVLVQRPYGRDADHGKVIGVIIAAALTLIMYSFLYRDNPLFKIAENLYVGVALGYGAILTVRLSLVPEVVKPIFFAPTAGAMYAALLRRCVPIVLGLLLLTRVSRKRGWLSRYSYALLVGWGAGVGISVVTHSYILKQLQASVEPLQAAAATGAEASAAMSSAWWLNVACPVVGAAVILAGTVAVLFYFFFSVEHRGAGGAVSRVGIYFLMISFGASFGYTVMGRLSLLIGRVRFLLFEWLKLTP